MPLADDYAAFARGMDRAQNRLIDEALAIYAGLAPHAQARFRQQMEGLTKPIYTGPNPRGEIILDQPKDDQP